MSRVKQAILIVATLIVAGSIRPIAGAGGEKVYKGYITDSQCAMNVHSLSQSHKEMLQSKSVGTTPADCVWYCVKQRGGRFVLQEKSRVYKLDDQNISREMCAKRVRVTGELDKQTNTIHVQEIQVISEDESRIDY
ncbi:MAG TPA: DUF5818 domain-containing protein [Candidatus Limnocylindrales bacterium]|nr:DUF5818 domain-containing protein [Candidatus Limnocylindrales bacterium]